MVNNNAESKQTRISKYIKNILNIEHITVNSLMKALAQFSNMTIIFKRKLYFPSRYYNSNNATTLIVSVSNCKLIIKNYKPLCYFIIIFPLFIYEYKYFAFFNQHSNILRHKQSNPKRRKENLQKPTISITYIESNTPNQYVNYDNISDINFFYNKTKYNSSSCPDRELTCTPASKLKRLKPKPKPFKKSLSGNESIKGKSFDEIYDTVFQMRKKKQILIYEENNLVSNNSIIFSAFLKKRGNQNN